MARWDRDVIDWHNVNLAQGFAPARCLPVVSKDAKDLQSAERNYQTVMARYGQQPGGGFVGDENCRPGRLDPQGGIETCGIVEFMHSFEMLTRITGLPRWADRCEEIALNSFPASMTPDQKGLHYITSVNQVQLDRNNKSPGIQNGGTMFSYSPGVVYRCCQHNVSHGWPYYAEELLAGHGRQRPVRLAVCPQRRDRQGGPRRGGVGSRGNRLSVPRFHRFPTLGAASRAVSALSAGAAMVRCGERDRSMARRSKPRPGRCPTSSWIERGKTATA